MPEQEGLKPQPNWREQLKSLSGAQLESGIRFFQINILKIDIAGQLDLAAQNQNNIANPGIIIDMAERAIGLGIVDEVSLSLEELGKNRAVIIALQRQATEAGNNDDLAVRINRMQGLIKVAEAFGWDKDTNPQSQSSILLESMKGYISANTQILEDWKSRQRTAEVYDATLSQAAQPESTSRPAAAEAAPAGRERSFIDNPQDFSILELVDGAAELNKDQIAKLFEESPYKLAKLIQDGFLSEDQIRQLPLAPIIADLNHQILREDEIEQKKTFADLLRNPKRLPQLSVLVVAETYGILEKVFMDYSNGDLFPGVKREGRFFSTNQLEELVSNLLDRFDNNEPLGLDFKSKAGRRVLGIGRGKTEGELRGAARDQAAEAFRLIQLSNAEMDFYESKTRVLALIEMENRLERQGLLDEDLFAQVARVSEDPGNISKIRPDILIELLKTRFFTAEQTLAIPEDPQAVALLKAVSENKDILKEIDENNPDSISNTQKAVEKYFARQIATGSMTAEQVVELLPQLAISADLQLMRDPSFSLKNKALYFSLYVQAGTRAENLARAAEDEVNENRKISAEHLKTIETLEGTTQQKAFDMILEELEQEEK